MQEKKLKKSISFMPLRRTKTAQSLMAEEHPPSPAPDDELFSARDSGSSPQ
jgi:hypothetical protein